jgi:glycosyltransferase involved in cell wall biosynthesis
MVALGHETAVLCHGLPHQKIHENLAGVSILRCPMAVRGKKIPLLGLTRWNQIRRHRPQVIMERFDTFGGMGAILARWLEIPLLLEVNYPHLEEMVWKWQAQNNWLARQKWLIGLLKFWNRWQFQTCRAVVAPLLTIVPDFALHRTHLVNWGADFTKFKPLNRQSDRCARLRRTYNLNDKRIIIFVSSFRPWHGVLDLPEIIVETIKRTSKQVLFLLIGSGKEKQDLENQIRSRGLSGYCLLVGQQPHDLIPHWLGLADIAIAPFNDAYYPPIQRFGFFWSPAKIFEYMASGLPVVTADYHPLNRIVVDGVNGRTVSPGDYAAYGESIAHLLESQDEIKKMGRNARKTAETRFGWCHHAGELEGILQKLVHGAELTSD